MALMGFRSSLNVFIIAETFANKLNKPRYNLTKMCFYVDFFLLQLPESFLFNARSE